MVAAMTVPMSMFMFMFMLMLMAMAMLRAVIDAHGVHDTLAHDHRLQTLVADGDHLLVHTAHTSHSL